MLSTGEADYALAWSGRIATAKDEGSPVDMTYNGGIMISAGWVVPKNAPNKENAMKFIEFISEAEQQYGFSELIPYGSTNPDAVALMSEEMKESLGQSDAQLSDEIYLDNTYWAEYLSEVEERFNAWLLA
jgi:putative spermidine/putrescine transport system substrate-binding protein